MNGGVLGPPVPVVHHQLLFLAEVEGEVVALAPHCQVSDLLPIGCLIVASSANVMMVLESCAVTQTWMNREYRRGQCGRCVVACPHHLREYIVFPPQRWYGIGGICRKINTANWGWVVEDRLAEILTKLYRSTRQSL